MKKATKKDVIDTLINWYVNEYKEHESSSEKINDYMEYLYSRFDKKTFKELEKTWKHCFPLKPFPLESKVIFTTEPESYHTEISYDMAPEFTVKHVPSRYEMHQARVSLHMIKAFLEGYLEIVNKLESSVQGIPEDDISTLVMISEELLNNFEALYYNLRGIKDEHWEMIFSDEWTHEIVVREKSRTIIKLLGVLMLNLIDMVEVTRMEKEDLLQDKNLTQLRNMARSFARFNPEGGLYL